MPKAAEEHKLEFTIDAASCGSPAVAQRLQEQLELCIERIPELLRCEQTDSEGGRLLAFEDVKLVLTQAFHEAVGNLQVSADFVHVGACPRGDSPRGRTMSRQQLMQLLLSPDHRAAENGRFYVGLSLSEAETVRRILHARQGTDVIDGAATRLALRHIGRKETCHAKWSTIRQSHLL